jgi:hypothetical protein
MGSNTCSFLIESLLIGGFVKGQHYKKVRHGAEKRLMAY